MSKKVTIYCPDCRGRFEEDLDLTDLVEGDPIECPLCGAELEIVQTDPLKVKLFSEDDYF